MELDPASFSPEEITSKEVELANDSNATDIVLVTLPKHGSWNSNCTVH